MFTFTAALSAWWQAWKPRSTLSKSEWGRKHVRLAHSMRSDRYDPDQSYWFRKPLDASAGTELKEIIIIGPPGSAKTTIFEVDSCHCIAEDSGPYLMVNHNAPMTEQWFESRGKPVLRDCKPVAALWPTNPVKDKKDVILFDHMPYWIGGANEGTLQSKSCRFVRGDEVWQWRHGMMREARARLHDRWNGQCIFVSQGGEEKLNEDANTELFDAWKDSTMEVAYWTCPNPGCGHLQPFAWTQMRYDECRDGNGICDYEAAGKSARYVCAKCETEFPDEVTARRKISASLDYVATNPKPTPRVRGFQYPAWCVWWIPWATIVIEWIKANEAKHRGDLGPLKIWKQKRAAEFWTDELAVPHGALRPSGYTMADYAEGIAWIGELYRFLTIDKQKDHFIVGIRAWKPDGSSRLLFEGRINTESGLRDLQVRYKVPDGCVFIDARYEPTSVYELCAKFNWTATIGEERDSYTHRPKNRPPYERYFSPLERVNSGAAGYCYKVNFGNKPLKDILTHLRSQRVDEEGNVILPWETPDDASHEYRYQIDSEVERTVVNKVTKQPTKRYVKVRPNHRWDVEVLQVLGACIANLIGEAPAPMPAQPMPEPSVDN